MENSIQPQKERINAGLTTQPIQVGNFDGLLPEFGRTEDVQRHFGIKKGTLYNLHKQRKVRGKFLRVTGEFKGVRLWDMASIRDFIVKNSTDDFGDSDNSGGLAVAA